MFQPETGPEVLFVPPNIDSGLIITINAKDEDSRVTQTSMRIIDKGIPPQPGEILINELAWGGTLKSSYDEDT